ncbi:hypothetical protein LX36DRAFT_194229 [Colletotrichum falcatum]|nr:hypothetical protein LX36DRAFT_194229 [Colletotrichum falcatum]
MEPVRRKFSDRPRLSCEPVHASSGSDGTLVYTPGGCRHASAVINTSHAALAGPTSAATSTRTGIFGGQAVWSFLLAFLLSLSLSLSLPFYLFLDLFCCDLRPDPQTNGRKSCVVEAIRIMVSARLLSLDSRRIAQRMEFMSIPVQKGVLANFRPPFDLMPWAEKKTLPRHFAPVVCNNNNNALHSRHAPSQPTDTGI